MAGRRKTAEKQTLALADHLKELRNRFFLVAAALLLASSLVYAYRSQIIPIILQPYEISFDTQKLMYLNPAGGFSFIFFISIYLGLAATLPILIHQIYSFIKPTLPPHKRSIAGRLLLSSSLLLVAGMLFGYYIAVPGALDFLREFASDYVSAALTAESYLHFLVAYTVGLGILFQIPLLLIATHYIHPLTPIGLLKSERWVIVLVMIAAAIITPTPDPINMLIVAVPILGIYQLGVVVVLISIYSKRRRERRLGGKATQVAPTPSLQQPVQPVVGVTASPKPSLATRPSVRSVDGFVASRTRPAPSRPSLPSRPTPSLARSVPRETNRSHRYIDGVSPIYRGA